jgi:hypothetical protein
MSSQSAVRRGAGAVQPHVFIFYSRVQERIARQQHLTEIGQSAGRSCVAGVLCLLGGQEFQRERLLRYRRLAANGQDKTQSDLFATDFFALKWTSLMAVHRPLSSFSRVAWSGSFFQPKHQGIQPFLPRKGD